MGQIQIKITLLFLGLKLSDKTVSQNEREHGVALFERLQNVAVTEVLHSPLEATSFPAILSPHFQFLLRYSSQRTLQFHLKSHGMAIFYHFRVLTDVQGPYQVSALRPLSWAWDLLWFFSRSYIFPPMPNWIVGFFFFGCQYFYLITMNIFTLCLGLILFG